MLSIEEEIAAELLLRFEAALGYRPKIEQVDFHDEEYEDGQSYVAVNIWHSGADEYNPVELTLPKLEVFDVDACEGLMCAVRPVSWNREALVRWLLYATMPHSEEPVPTDPEALARELQRRANEIRG